jgi:hypothetical protein
MPALVWGPPTEVAIAIEVVSEAETSATSVSIGWNVTPASQGEIRYGTVDGGPYTFVTNRENGYLGFHQQNILGLTPSTTYFYRIWARDATGREDLSEQGSFIIGAAPSLDYPPAIPLAYLAKPVFTAPTAGQVKEDPQYGTEVTRITSTGARVRYASKAVLNSDQSLGVLDGLSGGRVLFNGQTLAVLQPNITTYGGFTLSATNPNRAYAYSNPNIIRILNLDASGTSIDHSVTLSGVTSMILGGNQGSQDNNDTYLAIQAQRSNGNIVEILWSIETETIVGEVVVATSGTFANVQDACGISQSGDWFYQGFKVNGTSTTQGGWRWPTANFSNTQREQITTENRHWDAGLLEDGTTDVLFISSQNSTGTSNGGYSGIFRFDNGAWTPMVASWPNGSPSCRNILRPGYGVLSSFSDMDTNPTFPGYSNVIAVRFSDPPVLGGDVENFGNIHGPYSTVYEDQPNACPSPDLTRIFTNATWDGAPVAAYAFGMDVVR